MTIDLRDYTRTAAQRGWGAGWPSCNGVKSAGTAVVTAARSEVRVSVHKRLARLVSLLVDDTERRGYLLSDGQCGGYNCRAIAGTSSPSNHSWALALDINWKTNPYARPRRTDMPPWMPQLWNRYGFAWGGNYNDDGRTGKADSMHLEFMGTPDDADAMTALALRELAEGDDDDMSAEDSARIARLEQGLTVVLQQLCGPGATIAQPFPGDAKGGGWETQRYNADQERLTAVMYLQRIERQVNSALDLAGRPGTDLDNAWGHALSTRAEVRQLAVKLDTLRAALAANPVGDTQLTAIAHTVDDLARRVLALEARTPA